QARPAGVREERQLAAGAVRLAGGGRLDARAGPQVPDGLDPGVALSAARGLRSAHRAAHRPVPVAGRDVAVSPPRASRRARHISATAIITVYSGTSTMS